MSVNVRAYVIQAQHVKIQLVATNVPVPAALAILLMQYSFNVEVYV